MVVLYPRAERIVGKKLPKYQYTTSHHTQVVIRISTYRHCPWLDCRACSQSTSAPWGPTCSARP